MTRIGLDCTPLLGRRTGVGTYTAELVAELARAVAPQEQLIGTAFTLRGRGELARSLPDGVTAAARPVPARLLRAAWSRMPYPRVGALCGPVDVFHATNFVLPPTGRAAGIVTVHDLAYLRYPETVSVDSLAYRHLVPAAIARGADVITPSRAVADQVRDAYRIDPQRVHPIHLGVDVGWFDVPPGGAGLPAEYLLAVGTLEPRKNLPVLLEVWRRAKAAGRPLPPLVLVGGQGWGSELDLTGLTDQDVVLTGYLSYEDLRPVVAGAAALLFPSLDEGFGLPPLEALACGTPVVAADIPVLREVLGDQARFVPPLDAEAIADAVAGSLEDPVGTRRSRRAHAREFTWTRTAAAHLALYRDVAPA